MLWIMSISRLPLKRGQVVSNGHSLLLFSWPRGRLLETIDLTEVQAVAPSLPLSSFILADAMYNIYTINDVTLT